MDSIELARRRAAELNSAAVTAGVDPWDAMALVRYLAKERQVEIDPLSMGSSLLNGNRATFDPQFRLIQHETTGTPFLDAFLIAHELGHVELGDGTQPSEAQDVDVSRAAEMPPVGAERVEDYGRRQRREVQMDLFAREFLMPRSFVRYQHVTHGLTATALSARLGAPYPALAQQLIDALLLPEPAPESAESSQTAPKPLNEEQRLAAEHSGVPFLLEAGPGTGKTQALVGRIDWLLSKDVDPRSILVLTFSNKAAGELQERVAKRHPEAAASMWIGTFHAFGLDLVRRFHDRLGLPDNPRMLDKADAIEMLTTEAPRLGLHHFKNLWDPSENLNKLLAAISRAKDELVDVDGYADLAANMVRNARSEDDREEADRQVEVAGVYMRYEELKQKDSLLDFGDLVVLPIRLFRHNPDVRDIVAATYTHVLVDEYQDVNRSSVALLKELKPTGENLWAVGDIKQSIYRFRGASSLNIANFKAVDFPGARVERLRINYRSSEEIVETFSAFASRMTVASGSASALTAFRGRSGVPVEHRRAEYADNEMEAIAESILSLNAADIRFRDQAVLCTGNDKLAKIGIALESLGIPVLYLGSIFERPEIKDLLSLMSLIVDPRGMGMVRVATMPQFSLSLGDVAHVIDVLKTAIAPLSTGRLTTGDFPNLSPDGSQSMQRLLDAIEGFSVDTNPWAFLAEVLVERTDIAARLATDNGIASRAKGIAIWQLLNFMRTQPRGSGLPITRLLERIRSLVYLSDERDLRQLPSAASGLDAVKLMTVHGSKGLEFRAVHFPGINADGIPRSANHYQGIEAPDGLVKGAAGSGADIRKRAHADEQECLFYVALSRARDRLCLYSPSKKKNGVAWGASPFLSRITPPANLLAVRPSVRLISEEEPAVAVVFPEPARFKDSDISLFERCPKRFFYTHILGIGGRRVETPFMKMHSAVQAVVDWITARDDGAIGVDQVHEELGKALAKVGLDVIGYADDYRVIANGLLKTLMDARLGTIRIEHVAAELMLGAFVIEVRVDEIVQATDGNTVLRRVRTGHGTSKAASEVSANTLMLAGLQDQPYARIELLFLSDGTSVPLNIPREKLQQQRQKVIQTLDQVAAGLFAAKPSNRTCPRCPAFFVCGPIPLGRLEKKLARALPVHPSDAD